MLIKIGLRDGLASLCLAPFALINRSHRGMMRKMSWANCLQLALLGVIFYTIAQGAQYVSLTYLPAVMVNQLLNLTPIFVGVLVLFALKDPPTALQWIGILLAAIGTGVYFLPIANKTTAFLGLVMALLGLLGNSIATLKERHANCDLSFPPLLVTFVSMGSGRSCSWGLAWRSRALDSRLFWIANAFLSLFE